MSLFPMTGEVDSTIDARFKRATAVDRWNLYLREKHSLPESWAWCEVSCAADDAPKGFYRLRGGEAKRHGNGRQHWRGVQLDTFFLDVADYTAWAERRGIALDECPACLGVGHVLQGVSVRTGNTFRECQRCGTTGKYEIEVREKDA